MNERLAVTLPRSRYRAHLEALHYAWERGTDERNLPRCQTGCDLLMNAVSEIELDYLLVKHAGPSGLMLRALRSRVRGAA